MLEERENGQEENYSFLQETLKDEKKRPKSIAGDICRLAAKGLIFGLFASVAFSAIQPWTEAFFAKETDVVTIPEDDEVEAAETQEEGTGQEFSVENYREMTNVLTDVAKEASKSIVVVETVIDDSNLEHLGETSPSVSGVIVWKNQAEVLIAAPSRIMEEGDGTIQATFNDGRTYEAKLKKQDKNLGLAIISVMTPNLSQSTKNHIQAAVLGNSNLVKKGTAVIALGNQFGYSGGSGYGIISTIDNYHAVADHAYRLLTTDIAAAESGSGVLFNTEGEVIGIGDQMVTGGESKNLVTGYAISGIKEVLELLANGNGVPYLGIHGVEITEEIAEAQGIPRGLYVKVIEADSPAMKAGIQNGDIIVSLGDSQIKTLYGMGKALEEHKVGEQMKLVVQRLGTEAYAEVTFSVTVGSKE